MMIAQQDELLQWLLEGDVSIRYQARRDLMDCEDGHLRKRIAKEGWGARLLSYRRSDGHWGRGYYHPKWTSSHYILLDLKNLSILPDTRPIRESLEVVLKSESGMNGGIAQSSTHVWSDVCVNGMVLNFASYFRAEERDLRPVVDFILSQHMPDGGFNCEYNRTGAVHSSLHSTLSVVEGITEYAQTGYTYRLSDLRSAERESREFILRHGLFRSERTSEIIDKKMLMLSFPSRWRYDILRALDYFRSANVGYDSRMEEALGILAKKRRKNGKWPVQARHPGATYFDMEKAGSRSRWNTLRGLRVLNHFGWVPDVRGHLSAAGSA